MIKKDIQQYYKSWAHFEQYCRNKAKDRCLLNTNCWRKLRDYHLNDFLHKLSNPYNFLFMVKIFHYKVYKNTPSMRRYYHKYAKKRKKDIENSWCYNYWKVKRD